MPPKLLVASFVNPAATNTYSELVSLLIAVDAILKKQQ
jgi:hypothetical protein